MLFAETDWFAAALFVGLALAALVYHGYMLVCRPEIFRERQQQKHEREIQKRQRSDKLMGLGGSLLGMWLKKK
ncbi:MAG: hypothetical protein HY040_07510 [Planctomycetes bacterium]|nr:hypothetical protein [Planctomycetota bacterium]